MTDVKILDKITANQIAAGEVVEKPASVVKELAENALDAGATQIEVTVYEGGTEFIRVADNGTGMSEANAKLAILPHATSKIRQANDLLNLDTLGFRGEALPSIASVSKFRLITRIKGSDFATEIFVDGGKEAEISQTGGNIGTTVIAEELFFNVPARRKFLKTNVTEGRYITEVLIKLALARPDVAFKFFNNDKEVLATTGDGDLKNVIRSLYGKDIADHLLAVQYEFENVNVHGYISKPTVLKNTRQWQTFLVNNRSVGSKMLAKAVDHAYQSMIPRGGFPFAVLHIDLDKATVDVNVHPQKAEVKFSDEGLVYRAVYHALTETLTKPSAAGQVQQSENKNNVSDNFLTEEKHSSPTVYEEVPIFKSKVAEPTYDGYISAQQTETFVPFNQVTENLQKEEINFAPPENKEQSLTLWPIGQVDKTFIIAQSDTSLFLIDQHAAHERILYDKLVALHENVPVQNLVVPLYVDMDADDVEIFVNRREELLTLGVDAEAGGDAMLKINALPVDIETGRAEDFLQEIAKYLRDNRNINSAELRAEVLHMAACKAAIKAGQELNMRQMRDLIIALCNTSHPFTCPHGRPCMIEITTDELYKMFKRTGF